MKKYSFVFLTICICLLAPTKIWAAGSNSQIGTSVPTTHTIAFESEHASVEYIDSMQEGSSTAYPVPRFSEPCFQIQTDTCWNVEKVLLDEVDITSQMTEDGVLKLDRVSKDQTVTIVCQEEHTWGEWAPEGDGQYSHTCTETECGEKETEEISSASTGDNSEMLIWCMTGTLSSILIAVLSSKKYKLR